MKKNKGFTLIELLAVIIILGIIITIVGFNAVKTKKQANDEELKKQAKMLADLAPGIYAHEKVMNPDADGDFMIEWNKGNSFYIKDEVLINAGYLDGKIKSPYTGKECNSYLEFKKNSVEKGDYVYIGYINCDSNSHIMISDGNESWNDDNYNDSIVIN